MEVNAVIAGHLDVELDPQTILNLLVASRLSRTSGRLRLVIDVQPDGSGLVELRGEVAGQALVARQMLSVSALAEARQERLILAMTLEQVARDFLRPLMEPRGAAGA